MASLSVYVTFQSIDKTLKIVVEKRENNRLVAFFLGEKNCSFNKRQTEDAVEDTD